MLMRNCNPTIAKQVGRVAIAFQQQSTGHAPESATVVLSEDTLVVTLRGALTRAEKALSQSPAGAAQVQEYHRQLFADASAPLRGEIERITGVDVREATAEIDARTGSVAQVFATGTMVQVFLLAQRVRSDSWSGNAQDDAS